ncbi:MAG: hypothetical protein J6M27_02450, partial [Lachnospiraceae bacterium]|nr:hypothetical protein [Lachnospiraceae bacterium]
KKKKRMNKNITIVIMIGILFVFLMIMIGPMDYFTHGFYTGEDHYDLMQDGIKDILKLDSGKCVVRFSPVKDHFAGIEVCLMKEDKDEGNLNIITCDSSETVMEQQSISLQRIKNGEWYKIYLEKDYWAGEEYYVIFSEDSCSTVPGLPLADSIYLPNETCFGNIMLRYAYAESTFSDTDKILLSILLVGVWFGIAALLVENESRKRFRKVFVFIMLMELASWNYMNYSLITPDENFVDFEDFSEMLVVGKIWAKSDGTECENKEDQEYNLARYENLRGVYESESLDYVTDEQWQDGYNLGAPVIAIDANELTYRISAPENIVRFGNGEEYRISDRMIDGNYILVFLDSDHLLDRANYGSLDDAVFYTPDHQELPTSRLEAYRSHYGLQGKIFTFLASGDERENGIGRLNLICALVTAAVFVVLTFLLKKRYNTLFAGCFYITWLLSPWISGFAHNLYWVEFTWFLPMLAGLICSMRSEVKKCRIVCYIFLYVGILIRSLCGYEYVSTIMMSAVTFLAADIFLGIIRREEKEKIVRHFQTFIIASIMALLGFVTAILIHSIVKGNGDITRGMLRIWQEDVMRRTNGADLNAFDSSYWPSMNASVWEVFCKYFHFKTEILTGIPGSVFPVICLAPIVILAGGYWRKKTDYEMLFLYVWFFGATISWYCLAKSHSYVHVHLNYVLWYIGFVPICLYIICKGLLNAISISYSAEEKS